jgi:hypothetical protein
MASALRRRSPQPEPLRDSKSREAPARGNRKPPDTRFIPHLRITDCLTYRLFVHQSVAAFPAPSCESFPRSARDMHGCVRAPQRAGAREAVHVHGQPCALRRHRSPVTDCEQFQVRSFVRPPSVHGPNACRRARVHGRTWTPLRPLGTQPSVTSPTGRRAPTDRHALSGPPQRARRLSAIPPAAQTVNARLRAAQPLPRQPRRLAHAARSRSPSSE